MISKREVVNLRARANLLFALLSQSDQDLEWHRRELQGRNDDVNQLRAELQRRDDDLGQLRAQLQRIVNSRSWRGTKPLRALSRLVKRMLGLS
jgi:hypothetical protein